MHTYSRTITLTRSLYLSICSLSPSLSPHSLSHPLLTWLKYSMYVWVYGFAITCFRFLCSLSLSLSLFLSHSFSLTTRTHTHTRTHTFLVVFFIVGRATRTLFDACQTSIEGVVHEIYQRFISGEIFFRYSTSILREESKI